MVERFGISLEEAIGGINRQWKGYTMVGYDIVHHEEAEYWAYAIYYGRYDAFTEEDIKKGILRPKPYPSNLEDAE